MKLSKKAFFTSLPRAFPSAPRDWMTKQKQGEIITHSTVGVGNLPEGGGKTRQLPYLSQGGRIERRGGEFESQIISRRCRVRSVHTKLLLLSRSKQSACPSQCPLPLFMLHFSAARSPLKPCQNECFLGRLRTVSTPLCLMLKDFRHCSSMQF